MTEPIRIESNSLREFVANVLQKSFVPESDSLLAADVLCTADEWGIRSHGVSRLRSYYEMLQNGRIKAIAKPRIVRDNPTVAVIDGDNGLGMVVAAAASKIAFDRGASMGAAWVSVFNSNHFGIAGYYVVKGLERQLIGIAMTNTPAVVSQFLGTERMLGTNPIAVAFPAGKEPAVVIDMATSAVSLGVVENALREGTMLPPGVIASATGTWSTDPHDFVNNGSLLPLGSNSLGSAHKGYCLTALIDIFCGPLSGAQWGPFVSAFRTPATNSFRQVGKGIGHLFGALSVGAFTEIDTYHERIDDWIRTMRSSPPIVGNPPLVIPGDPERNAAQLNRALGIPLDQTVALDLERLARAVCPL